MKKKIGEIIITNKALIGTNVEPNITIPIWGTIFKNDKEKLFGGVYFSISPEILETYIGLVKHILMECPKFKMSFKREFWGEYFSISFYGDINYTDFDKTLQDLKWFNGFGSNNYSAKVFIEKDFKYVVDSNIVENI